MRGGPVRLGDVLRGWRPRAGLASSTETREVFRAFGEVTRDGAGKRLRPVRFRDGELLVEVESSAHLHEWRNFERAGCLARLNSLLGAPRVRTLRFRAAGAPDLRDEG